MGYFLPLRVVLSPCPWTPSLALSPLGFTLPCLSSTASAPWNLSSSCWVLLSLRPSFWVGTAYKGSGLRAQPERLLTNLRSKSGVMPPTSLHTWPRVRCLDNHEGFWTGAPKWGATQDGGTLQTAPEHLERIRATSKGEEQPRF